jgi:hypothetical protein
MVTIDALTDEVIAAGVAQVDDSVRHQCRDIDQSGLSGTSRRRQLRFGSGRRRETRTSQGERTGTGMHPLPTQSGQSLLVSAHDERPHIEPLPYQSALRHLLDAGTLIQLHL